MIDGHVHLTEPAGAIDTIYHEITGRFGKLIEQDGSAFQYLPPYMKDSCFDAETLIATMDYYGIDKAVVLAHIGSNVNQLNYDALIRYPDRIVAACAVNPYDADAALQLSEWGKRGMRIAKFEMRSINEMCGMTRLSSDVMLKAIEGAAKAQLAVAIDPGPCDFDFYHPEDFRSLAERFPSVHFVLCHMGLPHYGLQHEADTFKRWKDMISTLSLNNVWTDTSAIPDVFCEEEYPYASAMELLEYVVRNFGDKKVIWGTDIPGTLKNATYPQMIRAFERSGIFTESGLTRLFHENAMQAYCMDK